MNKNIDHKKISGEEIRKIRLSLGMTMEEFGKEFEPPASDSIVSRWERGVSFPNSKRIKRIIELSERGNTSNTTNISNYLDVLYEKARKRHKERSKIADDFDLKELEAPFKSLGLAVEHKRDITRNGGKLEPNDAAFLKDLYFYITESNPADFNLDEQLKLREIIALLLSGARDIDIDKIYKIVKKSEAKKKE